MVTVRQEPKPPENDHDPKAKRRNYPVNSDTSVLPRAGGGVQRRLKLCKPLRENSL